MADITPTPENPFVPLKPDIPACWDIDPSGGAVYPGTIGVQVAKAGAWTILDFPELKYCQVMCLVNVTSFEQYGSTDFFVGSATVPDFPCTWNGIFQRSFGCSKNSGSSGNNHYWPADFYDGKIYCMSFGNSGSCNVSVMYSGYYKNKQWT